MDIAVKNIVSKSILSKAQGYLDIGFTHSLNPYSGCIFACSYCYVREMPIQTFKEMSWGTWLEIKTNAAEVYRSELRRLRRNGKPVNLFMSSATDPYQPIERKAQVSQAILQAMVDDPPDLLQIQTRSPLVTRDLDLLVELNKKCELLVSITVETDREDMKRIFAPYAPGIKLRLKALGTLHQAGIRTQAAISPVLPFTPNFPDALHGIVDRIWIDTLMLGDGMKGKRSERLGMPQLFASHGLEEWYRSDIHTRAESYFKKHFAQTMIHVSKQQAFPNRI